MSIKAAFTSCLDTFAILIKYTETTNYHQNLTVPMSSWATQLSRLRTWSTNVGALEPGNASLDHVLHEPSRPSLYAIRDHIPELLNSIEGMAKEIIEDDIAAVEEKYEGASDKPETLLEVLFGCIKSHVDSLEQYARHLPGSKTEWKRSGRVEYALAADAQESGSGEGTGRD
ncbi:MAG: hypothetical protein LQ337_002976 [Flavoplaca oasis]|nr:MAG: hypothetical protein LQ337_002976 [Flavoplaca oasis]